MPLHDQVNPITTGLEAKNVQITRLVKTEKS